VNECSKTFGGGQNRVQVRRATGTRTRRRMGALVTGEQGSNRRRTDPASRPPLTPRSLGVVPGTPTVPTQGLKYLVRLEQDVSAGPTILRNNLLLSRQGSGGFHTPKRAQGALSTGGAVRASGEVPRSTR